MKCRNCGEGYKEWKNPCPYCGEANWSDERHQIGAENE
jgi:RNA polymerase subunit RPABC4/transcription elongation factor Spt4